MAKKAANKKEVPTVDQVALISPLARELGIHVQTLHSAVNAGNVESVALGCGSRAVLVKSAKAWAKSPRKRGPKPKED